MEAFNSRQQYIQANLNAKQALLIRQPKAVIRNNDVYYPFHPSRNFYYLSGFEEPDAWLLITKVGVTLWSQPNDPKRTLWEGRLMGEDAQAQLHIDQWHSILGLSKTLNPCLAEIDELFLIGALPDSIKQPKKTIDGSALIHDMRIIKDPHEIDCIRQACSISSQAHNALMLHIKTSLNEGAVAGRFLQEVMSRGANSLAYPTISASGANACTLHYTKNDHPIEPNDLVLVDAGCEYRQYCADITRTFPANGTFSAPAKALYEAVLDTQISAIELCKPNIRLSDIHQHAVEKITQHLIDLNIIDKPLAHALEKKLYLPYFPHRIGHTMGLDVHDVSPDDDTLQPGMVITIEPGLYVSTPGIYQGIGIRIEDNILITEQGYENLTVEAVKQTDSIQDLINS